MIDLATTEAAIATFAACLYNPSDLVETRLIRGTEVPSLDWMPASSLASAAPRLRKRNDDGWHVYAGPAPRTERGARSTEGCALWRTLWADWDGIGVSTVARQLEALEMPEPTLLLETGGGVHAYWRLREPIRDSAEWTGWNKGLSASVQSDPAVNKPPQVMRVPGFCNVKYDPPVLCRIVRFDVDARVSLEEMPIVCVAPPPEPAVGWITRAGEKLEPLPTTLRWMKVGSGEGTRSDRAFAAAADLIGCGFTEDEAISLLIPGANACGFPLRELEKVVESAGSRPRFPGRGEANANWAAERMARRRPAAPPEPAAASDASPDTGGPVAAAEPAHELRAVRPMIVNAISEEVPGKSDRRGNPTSKMVHRHVDLTCIRENVKAAMDGMPCAMNGLLFAYEGAAKGRLPSRSDLQFIGRDHQLFAWIQERCDLSWRMGTVTMPGGGLGTAVTRQELFESLKLWRDDDHQFSSVELVPHHPPLPGVWYAPLDLPPATGERLREFLGAFNPETELDRSKILAMLLTIFSGLPPGKRPAFVIAAKGGRGAGKTSTAKAASRLAGGEIMMAPDEDPAIFAQRLFSDDSLCVRVALIDNLKTRLDSGQLEAWITSTSIQGKRLYHGGASRPNYLTWIITANSPTVSSDIAQRSVIIQLGDQQIGARDFDQWVADFLAEHRAQVIADLLEILRSEPVSEIRSRDRWRPWQDAILSRLPDGEEVAQAIIDARPAVDADAGTAEDIASVLDAVVRYAGYLGDSYRVTLSIRDVAEALRWEGLADPNRADRVVIGWVRHQFDVPPLRGRLRDYGSKRHGRRLEWAGSAADPNAHAEHVAMTIEHAAEWRARRQKDAIGDRADEVEGIPI